MSVFVCRILESTCIAVGETGYIFFNYLNLFGVQVMKGGKDYSAYVLDVDGQFALLRFPLHKAGLPCTTMNCNRPTHKHVDEWVYRGSDRLYQIRATIHVGFCVLCSTV